MISIIPALLSCGSLLTLSGCDHKAHPDDTDDPVDTDDLIDTHDTQDTADTGDTGEPFDPAPSVGCEDSAFETIAEALDYFPDTKTIELCDGTYYEQLCLKDRSVSLMARPGNEAVYIDGSGEDRMITVQYTDEMTEEENILLSGLHLVNGYADGCNNPSALYIAGNMAAYPYSVHIENTEFSQNFSEHGGASWITFSSAGGTSVLKQVTVTGETNHGGTTPLAYSTTFQSLDLNAETDVQITQSTYADNTGSGIRMYSILNAIIDDVAISNNIGKGIHLSDVGTARLSNVEISGQEVGALNADNAHRVEGSSLEINESRIHNNLLTHDMFSGDSNVTAGLVLAGYGAPFRVVVADSELVDNDASYNPDGYSHKAGAIYLWDADLTVTNTSVQRNWTSGYEHLAGGIAFSDGAHVYVENSDFGIGENDNLPVDLEYLDLPGQGSYNFGDDANFECDGSTHECVER